MTGPADRLRPDEEEKTIAEESSSLWLLVVSPTVWAVHFAASYAITSLACVKFPDLLGVGGLQWIIGALTGLALAAILATALRSWRQWDFLEDYDHIHHRPRSEDRHEFLGHAAFLLSVVSFIGTVYVALPVWLTGTC
ncbi:hypothetical protein [Mangrovicoccus algicola]|uniref:Uncharacterized protein n=1 Tax=Mangrovicoccus algicola TaxID=2771008 RepID=A0A8J6YWM9_9RHOB|nr:hypothetical protein [Mangrovicoccus algicola]MBE3637624.1 hypothetical protein [Mangrovicoccus algicola]